MATIINFGKHTGTDITEIPIDYLVWLQDLDKNPQGIIKNGVDWSKLAQEEIIRRKHANYEHDLFSEHKEGKDSAKWVQATTVVAATPDGSYVTVRSTFGKEQEFTMCRVEWNNPFMDKTKSDVLVETPEYGWLRIWFNDADVQPFKTEETP